MSDAAPAPVLLADGRVALQFECFPGWTLAHLLTDLDGATASDIREALLQAILPSTAGHLVLDLSATPFLDSAGLGAIVAVYRQLRQASDGARQVILIGPSRVMQELLQLTHLERYLPWFPTRQDAALAHPWLTPVGKA